MNKKGFTLIELLAVILILGIIALIAIPTVNNIINESKTGAWKSTANNVVSSYERYYQMCQIKGDNACIKSFSGDDATGDNVKTVIGMKGDLPETFDALMLNVNGDALLKFTADSVTCQNYTGEDAPTEATTPVDMVCTRSGS